MYTACVPEPLPHVHAWDLRVLSQSNALKGCQIFHHITQGSREKLLFMHHYDISLLHTITIPKVVILPQYERKLFMYSSNSEDLN
jgi:hypothetical protein